MNIVLTGDSRADHFFSQVAVAEELIELIDEKNIADAGIHYFSSDPYNSEILFEKSISFTKVGTAKLPKGFNILSYIGFAITFVSSFFKLFSIFPDVVFSKGGEAALAVVSAAKVLGIPVIIHESNSIPDDVNLWSASFAKAIAVSYKQEVDYFPAEKVIHTGQPIRKSLQHAKKEGAFEFLGLEKDVPVVWVISGSSGGDKLNESLEESLPNLLSKYQVIHQTGRAEFEDMKKLTNALLSEHGFKYRYHAFPFLNDLSMKMAAGAASVVVARASSTLFEIAHWELPSIIVPLSRSENSYQIKNAYNYARENACIVIEENNLSDSLLEFEIDRIIGDKDFAEELQRGADIFSLDGAAEKIAEEIIGIGFTHEN